MPTLGSLPGSIPSYGSLQSRTSLVPVNTSPAQTTQALNADPSTSLPLTNTSQIVADTATVIGRANAPLAPQGSRGVNNQQTDPSISAEAQRQEKADRAAREQEQAEQKEQYEVRRLAEIDRDVRAHEAAHAAVGGGLTGAPEYEYTRGPDGRLYATSGEVSIDTRPVPNDPQATIEKAQTIIQAALAPRNPSPQDLSVAAQAQALLVEAQAQVLSEQRGQDVEARAEAGAATSSEASDERSAAVAEEKESDELVDEQQARQERAREQREDFARQLQELNSRLSEVQQQVLASGAIASVDVRGGFIDIQA